MSWYLFVTEIVSASVFVMELCTTESYIYIITNYWLEENKKNWKDFVNAHSDSAHHLMYMYVHVLRYVMWSCVRAYSVHARARARAPVCVCVCVCKISAIRMCANGILSKNYIIIFDTHICFLTKWQSLLL